ncbi:hypothetical protein PMI02_04154 [Novosphingobium sp. AP12]|nr:hypothetical protein PMI02_04154 [Novosphingobium sp. AP12]
MWPRGRKSSLFAGSEEGAQTWAVMASLLQTARLGGLDLYTWLNDVLERMDTGAVKVNELDILLPWNWRLAAGVRRVRLHQVPRAAKTKPRRPPSTIIRLLPRRR